MPTSPDRVNTPTALSCPLCEGPNECGRAAGLDQCWCLTARIPPEVIARIPDDAHDRVCVCQTCGTGAASLVVRS